MSSKPTELSPAMAQAARGAPRPEGAGECRIVAGICVGLLVLVAVVFGPTVRHGFVNYDDDFYVSENAVVAQGLTWEGVRHAWAFDPGVPDWNPLTTMSHLVDVEFYGLRPGGHHATNVALHAGAAVLLFLALRELTGARWRSAFVAALFAIHPLRAESVAWITERKDVLSGVFFMATLWAYARWVRRPGSRGRYVAVIVCFALGLLSKPILVTLPFVLLLLDYWPLNRLRDGAAWKRLLAEKWPLFALSALACAATLVAQQIAMPAAESHPFAERVANAVVAYGAYLAKFVWPEKLAVLYPLPKDGWALGQTGVAAIVLAAFTWVAWRWRREKPYLLVGWLWFLGVLVPVIGLVQVGQQAYADRYTYLSQIGLAVAIAWGAGEWVGSIRQRQMLALAVALVSFGGLLIATSQQVAVWRDSVSLWTHALSVTRDNAIAHYNLGMAVLAQGRRAEAMEHFCEALRLDPNYVGAHVNLGSVLFLEGRRAEAAAEYRRAIELKPTSAQAHCNLGNILLLDGKSEEALRHFDLALQAEPRYANAHFSRGQALVRLGRRGEAMEAFRETLRWNPRHIDARANLDRLLATQVRPGNP